MRREPTLDDFIEDQLKPQSKRQFPYNLHVRYPGFRVLYVRVTARPLDRDVVWPVLELASLEASRPGKGAFTKLIAHLTVEYRHMPIFVESVLEERFRSKLLAMGFKAWNTSVRNCFVLRRNEL